MPKITDKLSEEKNIRQNPNMHFPTIRKNEVETFKKLLNNNKVPMKIKQPDAKRHRSKGICHL